MAAAEKTERRDRRATAVRSRLLVRMEETLELPMVVLGLVWLILLVVELTYGPTPFLQTLSTIIWIVFILDFAIRLTLASQKFSYLLHNWLTVIALLVPALRVFRVFRAVSLFRAARAARGLRLVRLIASVNRGMRALGAAMGRHGFGYVVLTTIMVTLTGAAGMYAFENLPGGRGLNDYGTALWWTAMVMTTMASEYWPQSTEGRVLCFLLALYAFTVFGYVTATLATFLIGQESRRERSNEGERQKSDIDDLRKRVERLEEEKSRHVNAEDG